MAPKTTVAVLISLNLLFLATLSSSSALPPAAPAHAPQPSSCPIDIRDLSVCKRTLVQFGNHKDPAGVIGFNKGPDPLLSGRYRDPVALRGNIDQCCQVIRHLEGEAGICFCSAMKAGILPSNIRDMPALFSALIQDCGVLSDFQCA